MLYWHIRYDEYFTQGLPYPLLTYLGISKIKTPCRRKLYFFSNSHPRLLFVITYFSPHILDISSCNNGQFSIPPKTPSAAAYIQWGFACLWKPLKRLVFPPLQYTQLRSARLYTYIVITLGKIYLVLGILLLAIENSHDNISRILNSRVCTHFFTSIIASHQ